MDLKQNSPVRYLVAKYIADTWRNEPRNIGVIVLSPSGSHARFIGEVSGTPGSIDGRALRGWMGSPPAYRQWIQYWRRILGETSQPITALELLVGSSKGNFVLVEGGGLLDPVAPQGLGDVTDFLYAELVQARPRHRADLELEVERAPVVEQLSLDLICDNIIRKTSLPASPHFLNNYRLRCRVLPGVSDEEEELSFSHAYRNGTLRLFQRVPLSRGHSPAQVVHDCAWKFERVLDNKVAQREACVSLVYAPLRERSWEVDRLLRVLGVVSRVIDVSDETLALTEFQSLAALES